MQVILVRYDMDKEPLQRRSSCPINYGLEIFGDRWTLLVLRDLLLQDKRHFQELLESEEAIASNILTERLKRLEHQRIITKRRDPSDRRKLIYEPTKKGLGLVPVLLEIAAWSATHDRKTSAPKGFAKDFYADRDKVISNFKSVIPKTPERDKRTNK